MLLLFVSLLVVFYIYSVQASSTRNYRQGGM